MSTVVRSKRKSPNQITETTRKLASGFEGKIWGKSEKNGDGSLSAAVMFGQTQYNHASCRFRSFYCSRRV